MRYHYSLRRNENAGPVDLAELTRLAAAGVINDDTPVLPEGSQTWSTYGAVRQGVAASVAAEAVAAGVTRAGAALKGFSWGSMFFGMLLAILGWLTLPWTVLANAARELAEWGKQRLLPSSSSDLPVLTFYMIVMRNLTLVLWAIIAPFCSCLSLFGVGPFYRGYYGWNLGAAVGGFLGGLVFSYFMLLGIAVLFETLAVGVRMANDIKRIAQR